MSDSQRILLVDSDRERRDHLHTYFSDHGFSTQSVQCAESARDLLISQSFVLLIAATQLLGSSGLELCRWQRRRQPLFPIILLEPSNDCRARLEAFDAGADDVQSFPFNLDELLARVRALLRRATLDSGKGTSMVLAHRDLSIHPEQRLVRRCDDNVRLTVKEYDLLLYLFCHKEQVLPRQQILHAVWGSTWVGDDNLLDVYIRYLRKKIERPDLEPLIHTIRGVGFMLK